MASGHMGQHRASERRHGTTGLPRQRGQVLVIFALLLPVLVAMLAVLIDGGYLYGLRRSAQNAADAASLAAALAVGRNGGCDAGATPPAAALAGRNGAPGPILSYSLTSTLTPPGGPTLSVCQVTAATSITSPPFLSGVFGRSSLQAGTTAGAALAGIARYGNDPAVFRQAPLLPVALELSSFQTYGFAPTARRLAVTMTGPDGFFWFVPSGTSCSDTAIDTGVTAATIFTTTAGSSVTPCPLEADPALHDLALRTPVLRTVVLTSSNAGSPATVLGFAYLEVGNTQYGQGIVPAILGYFVTTGGPTAGSIGTGMTPNYGVFGVGLLR